ncbi:hypothetical protein PIROE2DRAFT_16714 [Piromyces sp. E2]|nr:hypothetical protein PIROE2DRAFT_16714 [Piromyces sp. E2]|eukprot:OUM58102.1 hypothetical protein PIROE2DRAFT_16714 [Piromyces sp. E2]
MSLNTSNYQNEMVKDDYSSKVEGNTNQPEIIEKRDCKEFPIISQQLDVYIESITNNNSVIYNVPMSFKLNKGVDIERIKKGFNQLFEKHQILKSKYIEKEVDGKSEIFGYIDENCKLVFEKYNYENAGSFVRPFTLSSAPLIRVGFIANEVLLIDMHRIISDDTTIKIIINEVNKYYNEGSMNELEVQFSDYAIYINNKKNSGIYQKQIENYKEMFDCDYEELIISNENQRSENGSENDNNKKKISHLIKTIDMSLSDSINNFVKKNEISKTAFFISIYGYILSKYSGQDVVFSSVVMNNRNNHYLENMIGMLVNTQPLLLKYEENDKHSFVEIMKENMSLLMNMSSNQYLSLSELKKSLKLKRLSNTFVYQPKSIMETSSNLNNSILSDEEYIFESFSLKKDNSSKFDIVFNMMERENDYVIKINYNNDMYSSELIERLVNSYIEMIKNIETFSSKLCDIEYIPTEEREIIVNEFNANRFEYPQDKLYHTEFSKLAKEIPDKCAIVCNGNEISYRKLDEMSNSLAHYLRNKGISKGDIVPIISERSQYYVIAALAVMKSGAGYLPVDPEFPYERIQYMIEECQSKLVLKCVSNEETAEKLKFEGVEEYSLQGHDYNSCTYEIENINKSDDICYVIFTSGTTGKPKGTLIQHSNLVNYCLYSKLYKGEIDMFEDNFECALAYSKFTFDMSVGEIHYPLLKGCKVVICNDEEFNNPELIGKLICENQVGYIFTAPSRIENYLNNEIFAKSLSYVKYMLIGGEPNYKALQYISANYNINIFHVYGPTETTVICSSKPYSSGSEITIGKPLCNCPMYVLDKYMKPVPIGVEGEIVIGGYGVGRGYINREELTNEMFIVDPFNSREGKEVKMYRSGDIGKWTKDGEVECLGRIDFQVKIRGQRIELTEIENTISELEQIDNSVVLSKRKENNEQYLVAYYISNSEEINGN